MYYRLTVVKETWLIQSVLIGKRYQFKNRAVILVINSEL